MKQTFGFALRIVSFITIPAAVGLICCASRSSRCYSSTDEFVARVDRADGQRAALLFAGTAGVRGDQADHADVLFDAGHDDAAQVGAYALALNIVLNAAFLLFVFGAICRTGARRWRVRSRLISILLLLFLIFRGRYGGLGARAILRFARQDGGLRGGDGGGVHTRLCGYSNFAAIAHVRRAGGTAGGDDRGFDGSLFRLGMAAAVRRAAGISSSVAAQRAGAQVSDADVEI